MISFTLFFLGFLLGFVIGEFKYTFVDYWKDLSNFLDNRDQNIFDKVSKNRDHKGHY